MDPARKSLPAAPLGAEPPGLRPAPRPGGSSVRERPDKARNFRRNGTRVVPDRGRYVIVYLLRRSLATVCEVPGAGAELVYGTCG